MTKREASAINRAPSGPHPDPVIGGTHVKPGELAAPGRRYGNLPGTAAAVVRPPEVEGVLDGSVPLVILDLPTTVLTAIARAVHLGAGVDGSRLFARVATGSLEAAKTLLADPNVREALTLTLAAEEAYRFAHDAEDAVNVADGLAAKAALAQTEPNPDDERDLTRDASLADELFDLGTGGRR